MVCCLLVWLFDDGAISGDPRGGYENEWHTTMMDAPKQDPLIFVASCCCLPCTQWYLRRKALKGDMTKYACCQNYNDVRCSKYGPFRGAPIWVGGQMGESTCPDICLFCEAWLFPSCTVSATRALVMDTRM